MDDPLERALERRWAEASSPSSTRGGNSPLHFGMPSDDSFQSPIPGEADWEAALEGQEPHRNTIDDWHAAQDDVKQANAEATAEEIHGTIHAHPTMSEAMMEAAAAVFGEAIHI